MQAKIAMSLIGIFGLFAFLNLVCWISTYVTRKYSSTIPLIGGLSGCIGFLLLPKLRAYALLPLILDVGTASFIYAAPKIFDELSQTSRFNLLKEYVGRKSGQKTVTIKLFKQSIFTIEQSFVVNTLDWTGEPLLTQTGNIGNWSQMDNQLELQIGEKKALFAITGDSELEKIQQIKGFDFYETSERTSLEHIELILTA